MALPKINTPTFELEIPSTKEKLTYRPFLVKEEKILLLAMEQDKEEEMMQAVKQIIDNCTFEKLDLDDLALFDIEFVFLTRMYYRLFKSICLIFPPRQKYNITLQ